ncbi:MAG: Acetate kinase [Elusimicrobia bacterium ADurb.Bin231]|nr:MAG: Acetate kinase [Elusimicrobia bacterium ADurb.Bin231]
MAVEKILVLNCGSSSVKYELCSVSGETCLAKGEIEAVGCEGTILVHSHADKKIKVPISARDHTEAINEVVNILISSETGIIKNKSEINAVGHRIVHGGAYFKEPAIVTEEVKKKLEDCFELAPLHTPHHLKGIMAIESILPNIPQILVFDTAFHQTIPNYAHIYGLPYRFYEKYNIRKYGFHGISHQYVTEKLSQTVGVPITDLKLISCHLGNGASVCAVLGGQSVDTSMGFTPLEGLMMGTRTGDMDPAVIPYLMSKDSLKPNEVQTLINKQSGILGISGISSDMRTVLDEYENGNSKARLAIDMFCYRVKKYITSYIGVLNGADYIIFTAGIGERSPFIRGKILENLQSLGIKISGKKNDLCVSNIAEISADDSNVKVYVVPTNEAMVIARQTRILLDNM